MGRARKKAKKTLFHIFRIAALFCRSRLKPRAGSVSESGLLIL